MAEIGQEPEKRKKRGTRVKATQRRAETGKRRSRRKRPTAKAIEEEAGDGAEQLKQAAESVIGKNSRKIAEVLLKKTIKGDISSAKLLLTLAESKKKKEDEDKRKREGEERRRQNSFLLQRLATEPQWEGPEPEDDDE